MIFQAVGGWYTARDIWRHISTIGRRRDRNELRERLTQRYRAVGSGQVALYHKGRAALSEAVRLATGGSGAVVVSGLTCYSLVQAVESAGARPVYVDIREQDLHYSGSELELVLAKNPDVKAVIVQNMLGIPADMSSIESVCRQHNIVIIEDLAHSAGIRYADGREAGTVGELVILSFGRDKALDVVSGGALIVRNTKFKVSEPSGRVSGADHFRDRLYPLIAGLSRIYYPIGRYVMGLALRLKLVMRSADGEIDVTQTMPAWQARLAVRQIDKLKQTIAHRRQIAQSYQAQLPSLTIIGATNGGASLIRAAFLVGQRDKLVERLMAHGVQANDIWYDAPIAPRRFMKKVNYPAGDCPVAVRVASQLINLPTHQRIGELEVKKIVKIITAKAIS
ncbi:MAG: aminotransferase class I/II-fold pyridoxal phosphate-dependent enzyme [Candidatus Saccharimonas sp.]